MLSYDIVGLMEVGLNWFILKMLQQIMFDSIYRKVPVVGKHGFELQECKVKISQNMVPRSILGFHIFWGLQYLSSKSFEGFDIKTLFSLICKDGPLNPYCTQLCPQISKLKAFDIINEWNYHIWRMQHDISKNLAPKLSWKEVEKNEHVTQLVHFDVLSHILSLEKLL